MLKELSASPDECAYIGDTGVDMQTGTNVGAALTIGVLWGFRKKEELVNFGADVIVTRPEEILGEVLKID
jgi:phosphoglycolate phosphatase